MSIAEKARNKTLTRADLQALPNGDDINKLEDGHTPLGFAVMNGDAFTIRLLLDFKASTTRKSANGLSPLHLAVTAKENAATTVKILLENAAVDVDVEDDSYPYDTPLMRALRHNPNAAVLQALKDGGASTTAKNGNGESAEDIADGLINMKAKETLLDPSKQGTGATELIRFIVAAVFLLLAYIKPWENIRDSVIAAFKMIYDQVVKPNDKSLVSRPATELESDLTDKLLTQVPSHPSTKKELRTLLDDAIVDQGLQSFFPPNSIVLRDIIDEAHKAVNDPALIKIQGRLSRSAVKSQFVFALYQPVLYCDDSGSMKEAAGRWDALKKIVDHMANMMLLFSQGGCHLRFINRDDSGLDSLRGQALIDKMNFTPDGWTPLGTSLNKKVLDPFVYSQMNNLKPLLIITISDGMPNQEDPNLFVNNITNCAQKIAASNYRHDYVKFCVSQVGDDKSATQFLAGLQKESQKPQYKDVLHVAAEQLDAKFSEFNDNEKDLRTWLRDMLIKGISGP